MRKFIILPTPASFRKIAKRFIRNLPSFKAVAKKEDSCFRRNDGDVVGYKKLHIALLLIVILFSAVASAQTAETQAPAKTPAKTAAKPQTPMGQLAPGHDSNQPIKITADHLEVEQDVHIAIFTGNVIAVQGDTTLKSEIMKVHYRNSSSGDAGGNSGAPKVKAATQQTNPGSVSLIEVFQNVFLTNPVQSAQGDNGTYDVDNHMVKLNGHVTLVKNKNIIKGDHLDYDTVTGKSLIYSAADKTKPGGRVESVFVQEKPIQDNVKKTDDAKQNTKQGGSAGQ